MEIKHCPRILHSFANLLALWLLVVQFWPTTVAALSPLQLVLGNHGESPSQYTVKETHFVPNQWTKIGIPSPEHLITLKIGMKNTKFHVLERHLYEVSDPDHKRYGKHLSAQEVDELVRPTAKALALVDEWLQDHGIAPEQCEYSSGKQWITLSLPVSKVEELLQTRYAVYQHEDGDTMVRTTSWSLPKHLHKFIGTIQPTTAFMRSAPRVQTLKELPETYDLSDIKMDVSSVEDDPYKVCNFSLVSPQCLRTLYKTNHYVPKEPILNQIGFTNYLKERTNRSDTAVFLSKYRPDAVSSAWAYREISINGGPIDDGTRGGGTEALLDVQTILGQVYPINVTSFSTGGSPPFNPSLSTPTNTNEPYLDWLSYVRAQPFIPQTISTSYGDDEQTVPKSYAEALCQGFAELGLRGVTILFSSGDNGVGKNGTCISNDGKNTTMFLPEFPGTCPYVTSVAGTRDFPEIVAYDTRNGYVSGSGFSNYFKRPRYQARVVAKYIKSLHGKYDGLYNKKGRAYPDLGAQGYRYAIFYNESIRVVDGTSASCPTTSSIISLVNDALVAAGRPTLGFLNPLLYSRLGKRAFNDVLVGSTTGCETEGFPAAEGWDSASGWGTPDFLKILKVLRLEA